MLLDTYQGDAMTIYHFQEVTLWAKKKLPCPSCGKAVTRSRTFTNTINPFNRNADGIPKQHGEVLADVREERRAWIATAEQCTPCKEADTLGTPSSPGHNVTLADEVAAGLHEEPTP